jgi:hypothetical protein
MAGDEDTRMTTEDNDEVWLDEETVEDLAAKVLEIFTPSVEARVKKLMNETIIDAVKHYLQIGTLYIVGDGAKLGVSFCIVEPPWDEIEHAVPLVEMLEDDLEHYTPRTGLAAIDYEPPDDDEDAPRIRLLRALIKAYYANGGTK